MRTPASIPAGYRVFPIALAVGLAAAALAWLVVGGQRERGSRCDSPRNVILLTVDTLRADHVTSAGYRRDTTPNIDEFFAAGTRFTSAAAGAPCTNPSMIQILTGRFGADEQTPRLAEKLRQRGYATAAVVSQHVFGWAEGYRDTYSRGFEHFDIQSIRSADRHGMSGRTAAEVTDAAIEWLGARDQSRPFFLWLHYFDPHDPYTPPSDLRYDADLDDVADRRIAGGDRRAFLMEAQRQATELGEATRRAGYDHVRANRWRLRGEVFSPGDARYLAGLYDGEIANTDRELARLFAALRDRDLVRETVLFLTADHGERLGEDDCWDHCLSLYGAETNVPLMALVAGGRLGDGRVVDHPVSTLDIVPTVLHQACVDAAAEEFHGVDLTEVSADRYVFGIWGDALSVRKGPWKLSWHKGHAELYDVGRDPGESADVVRQFPQVADELSAALLSFASGQTGRDQRFERIMKELEAIGYMK